MNTARNEDPPVPCEFPWGAVVAISASIAVLLWVGGVL